MIIDKLSFEQLFNRFIQSDDSLEDESLICLLKDSIYNHRDRFLLTSEFIDSVNRIYSNEFVLSTSNFFDDDMSIKRRNVFLMQIGKNDTWVEGGKLISYDSLDSSLKDFILNPNNRIDLPQKEVVEIDLLDTVMVTRHLINIYSQMIPDTNGYCTSFDQIKRIVNQILKTYANIRDDFSLEFFGKKFNKLSVDKQQAIGLLVPIRIWIFIDRKYYPVPLLPPPLLLDTININEADLLDKSNEEF